MPRKARGSDPTEPKSNFIPGLEEFAQQLSWSEVDQELLSRAIEKVTDYGHALIIGHTSDGGAMSLTVLAGDMKPRFYPASVEHAEKVLRGLCAWVDELKA